MVAINGFPASVTGATGQFTSGGTSTGYIQGHVEPDAASMQWLQAGWVAQSETIPMWGGVAVNAALNPISTALSSVSAAGGQTLTRATSVATTLGFTAYNQAHNLVIDTNNNVPTAGSGQSISYFANGSRARIAVQCDPSLISLRGGQINQQVSWDFVSQMLIPYTAAYGPATITNAVWSATNGGQVVFTVTSDLSAVLTAGKDFEVTGVVNTGGASTSAFNGMYTVVSSTSTTVTAVMLATVSPGTYASGGTIVAGGGALPVTVLDVRPTGNMVVSYNPLTGLRNWNFNGAAALIKLTGGTVA